MEGIKDNLDDIFGSKVSCINPEAWRISNSNDKNENSFFMMMILLIEHALKYPKLSMEEIVQDTEFINIDHVDNYN